MLSALSLAFLAVTVLYRARQDYYLYLQMWYEVRLGHDPWFNVPGNNGTAPLNAYGPLFNFLAAVSWVNPLAPKLLFAYAYIVFAILQTIGPAASRSPGVLRLIVLTALFWNPFPWVEIANRGHFDILVALLCLWAIRAWSRGRDVLAGLSLAMGVLLKYLPVVLVPFLAFDRGRPRTRFLTVAVLTIALGMELSCHFWGLLTLSPLRLAASRGSTALSIFRFIRGRYSPLFWFGVGGNYDYLSPIIIALALALAWRWSWVRRPRVEASALVAVLITVVFYQTGFPQYRDGVLRARVVVGHPALGENPGTGPPGRRGRGLLRMARRLRLLLQLRRGRAGRRPLVHGRGDRRTPGIPLRLCVRRERGLDGGRGPCADRIGSGPRVRWGRGSVLTLRQERRDDVLRIAETRSQIANRGLRIGYHWGLGPRIVRGRGPHHRLDAWKSRNPSPTGMSMPKKTSVPVLPPLRAAVTGEFLGTGLLILLGDGVVAGDVLLNKSSDKMMITTAWGLAVALSVYLCGRLSGGHINPAVTLALACAASFPIARDPLLGRATGRRVRRRVAGLRRLCRGVPGFRAQ